MTYADLNRYFRKPLQPSTAPARDTVSEAALKFAIVVLDNTPADRFQQDAIMCIVSAVSSAHHSIESGGEDASRPGS
jgi:hypothetical protein